MSQLVASPSSARDERERRVPLLAKALEDPSVRIGVIGTILIHIILLLLAPHLFSVHPVKITTRPHATPNLFNIEIQPDLFNPPRHTKPPIKFVETNPNAPENTPDKTNNFSNRNQQAAQEKPNPNGTSDRAATEGRKDLESTQVVTGHLHPPESTPPPAPQIRTPAAQAKQATPRQEQNPLSGFEKKQGGDLDAFGSIAVKPAENSKPVPERIEGAKTPPLIEGPSSNYPRIDPQHPQPRRTLEENVRPAIFSENNIGTRNIGPAAVDARWSNYGVYLQRMIESVQIEWERILIASRIYPASGTQVSVKFVMNSKGEITNILKVDPSAGSSDAANRACVSAISRPAPYGDWTDDMISVLGTEQEMTFTFFYE
jgi:hypothetical protein